MNLKQFLKAVKLFDKILSLEAILEFFIFVFQFLTFT